MPRPKRFTDEELKERARERSAKWREKHPGRHTTYKKEWYQENKEQLRARMKERYHANPDRHREQKLVQTKGVTFAERDALFEAQGSMCAVCGTTEPKRCWTVDHDHKTNQVRGVLCTNCNLLLGHAHDDTSVLASAISYLKQFQLEGVNGH